MSQMKKHPSTMISIITKIRHSLSLQISLWVLLYAVAIFVVSLGFLYIQT